MDFQDHWKEGRLLTPGGVLIRYGTYQQQEDFDRVLVLLNGRSEYVEKYLYVIEDLNLPPNWLFITMDHRGQGQSGGHRAHVDHYDDFASDATFVIKTLSKGRPYHIVTHSMGGLITLWAVLGGSLFPQSLHLLSPLLGIHHPAARPGILRLTAQAAGYLGRSKERVIGHAPAPMDFATNDVTNDPMRFEHIKKSPYGFTPISYGWLEATLTAIKKVHSPSLIKNLSCPVKISLAGQDRVVATPSSLSWAKKAWQLGHPVEVSTYKGQHELLSEKPEVYHRVIQTVRGFVGL